MIQRVALYFILPMCILAFFLSIAGVQHIQFGDSYYSFLRSVSVSFNSWKLEIPDIPSINKISIGDYDKSGLILSVLIKIANFFVSVVNSIILLINFVINILNIVVQIIQFVLTLIYRCKDFIKKVSEIAVV